MSITHEAPLSIAPHARHVEGTPGNTETLERFSFGLEELKAANPEIAGATLFGSRLKGEATEKSDVDCTIFIDADAMAQQGVHVGIDKTGNLNWGEYESLKRDFQAYFGNFLAQKTDKNPSVITGGIYIEPVSENLIKQELDQHLENFTNYEKETEEHWHKVDEWAKDLSDNAGDRPEAPEYVTIARNIPALFHPDLTTGLEDYREAVITRLIAAGPLGEKVWQDILDSLAFGEGHREITDETAYPINLAQAKEWYAKTDGIS